MRLIVDIVGFQLSWWASALGAAAGRWEPGLAVGLAVVAVQLAVSRPRVPSLITVLAAGGLAVVFETAMVASGLVRYGAPVPSFGLAPVWLVALWMVFGTCIGATVRMLGARPLLWGALLGAILAPPTYWFGMRLGALDFADPLWLPLAATAAAWAISTPLMMVAWRRAQG